MVSPKDIQKTAALVREYARSYETTPEAILLAWLLKHPAKIQPVLGTTRPDRLRSCVKSLSVSLSRDEWYSLFATAWGASKMNSFANLMELVT
jgi:predicted oxidoreductase